MKRILVFLAAAAMLMTACSPDNLTGTNNGVQNGGAPVTDGSNGTEHADNGTAGNSAAGNGTEDNGGMTDNGTDGADMNNGEAGTGSLRRNLRRGAPAADGDLPSDTLGDRDGDGFIENTVMDGPDGAAGAISYRRVRQVKSAEDARNFIGAGLLGECAASLPRMAEVRILEADEREKLADKAGITDADGVKDVVVAQAAGDDEDFSVVMLRTDGSHTVALSRELGRRVDAAKLHTCPAGEKTVSVTLDDDVVLLSGNRAEVAAALKALVRAADGVYGYVGSARIIEEA